MMEILRDSIWQFVGALLGLVAIVISVIAGRRHAARKTLSYDILSSLPLLTVAEEVKGRIQIVFDNMSVPDAHMVVLKLLNSGNVPIRPEDFVRKLEFVFGPGRIITAEVVQTQPADLAPKTRLQPSRVILEPLLINPGDFLILKVMLMEFTGNISIEGRVAGVSSIEKAVAPGERLGSIPVWLASGGVFTMLLGPAAFAMLFGDSVADKVWPVFFGLGILMVAAALGLRLGYGGRRNG